MTKIDNFSNISATVSTKYNDLKLKESDNNSSHKQILFLNIIKSGNIRLKDKPVNIYPL